MPSGCSASVAARGPSRRNALATVAGRRSSAPRLGSTFRCRARYNPHDLRSLALRPVLVVALCKSALGLAFAGRYGWQRDELYYAVAGRHLQGGYVDFPPVTAVLAALARVLFGYSLVGF